MYRIMFLWNSRSTFSTSNKKRKQEEKKLVPGSQKRKKKDDCNIDILLPSKNFWLCLNPLITVAIIPEDIKDRVGRKELAIETNTDSDHNLTSATMSNNSSGDVPFIATTATF